MSARHILLALVAVLCLLSAASGQRLRVRKEVRHLSSREYKMFMQGMAVMWSTSTEAGRRIYGPKFREMDYFIIKHAVMSMLPYGNPMAGNSIHFAPCFMTYHRAFNLEWENALLSVVPELRAMPWWEIVKDMSQGEYYQTPNWMYGPRWAGNKTGDASQDYAVMDGVFGGRMVSRFNFVKYGSVAHIFNGTAGTHLLRDPSNAQNSSYVTRYPSSNLAQLPEPWPCYDRSTAPFCSRPGQSRDFYPTPAYPLYYEIAKGLEMPYTADDLARCTNASLVTDSWDFIFCIEFPADMLSQFNTSVTGKWMNSISAWTHPMFHSITGSMRVEKSPEGRNVQGDARDLSTSPNEAMMFFTDHAALDRAFYVWQQNIRRVNPNIARPDVMYGFPTRPNCVNPTVPCTNPPVVLPDTTIDSVMGPAMPFTDIFRRPTPTGVTHRDMLNWQPDYVYDSMDMYEH